MAELTDHSIARERLIRFPEVQRLTGYARSTMYKVMQRDPSFPRPVQMSNSTARNAPVAFVLGEVLDWIDQRKQAREGEA